jgi:hypothetical protein
MILDSPVPFKEALLSRAVKKIFPTAIRERELRVSSMRLSGTGDGSALGR